MEIKIGTILSCKDYKLIYKLLQYDAFYEKYYIKVLFQENSGYQFRDYEWFYSKTVKEDIVLGSNEKIVSILYGT